MYLQVRNTKLKQFNQIQSTKDTLFKDVKEKGWKMSECDVSEIPPALIETKYRGADGKTITRRYKK